MSQQDVYTLLKKRDMTSEELVKELKIGQTSVNHNLRKLMEFKLIKIKDVKIISGVKMLKFYQGKFVNKKFRYKRKINVYGV